MSSYDALAASYDGLMADGVYRRRADYLEKLFRISRIPVRTVLDLACGTGTIACLLAAKGYAVTATDLSEEMLTQAMSKAAAMEQPPLFVQQSMPRLCLPEPVDAVVSTLDSLNYLTREKDIRETFRRVFRALKPGGSYFFEPERTLSRGEFIAMALAAMDVSAEEVQMTGFCDDASIPSWAKGYAVSALNAGVVSGISTAEGAAFRAGDLITLNEAAVVLNRLLRVTDVDLSDYDAQDAENAWCAQAVANLQSVSIIESGRFSADEMRSGVTRAQAAEMLSAAMTLRNDRNEKGGLLSGLFG